MAAVRRMLVLAALALLVQGASCACQPAADQAAAEQGAAEERLRKQRELDPHFAHMHTLHDTIFALCEGITVPFALAAGMSGASASSRMILTAGSAEVLAGSLALALGGMLASNTELHHWHAEHRREHRHVEGFTNLESEDLGHVFQDEFGLEEEDVQVLMKGLKRNKEKFVNFMLRLEMGLDRPSSGDMWQTAFVIGGSHLLAGAIPLLPYLFLQPAAGLKVSTIVTLSVLLAFGLVKGYLTDSDPIRSGLLTAAVGAVSASATFLLSKLIERVEGAEAEKAKAE